MRHAEEDPGYLEYCAKAIKDGREEADAVKGIMRTTLKAFVFFALIALVMALLGDTTPGTANSGQANVFALFVVCVILSCSMLFMGFMAYSDWGEKKRKSEETIIAERCLPYERWLCEPSPEQAARARAEVSAEQSRVAHRLAAPA